MKRTISVFFMLLLTCAAMAQVDRSAYEKQKQAMQQRYNQQKSRARQRYDDARRKAEDEYAAFRKRANEEYAAAMQRAWQRMGVQPPEPKPEEPKPPKPPAPPAPDAKPTTNPLPAAEVVKPPVVEEPPAIPAPPVHEPEPTVPTMRFAVYGTDCSVHTETEPLRFKLASIDDKGTSDAWKILSQKNYDNMLHDCLAQRDQLHLGDWGYICLLRSATEKLLGKGTNEATLLQMFLLTQSGYNVRLGRVDGRLALLVPFNSRIMGYQSTYIDDTKYYLLTKTQATSVEVCNVGYPREQVANVMLTELPRLKGNPQPKRTFSAKRFGTIKADIGIDKSLIDYMNDFPLLNGGWESYAHAGLSDQVKADLYPVLRNQIEGKSKQKAVFMILDFVQYAFDYATDQEQFGYERPLFGDESFFYPKNDCEDRAILFSILVRDIVGLDAVLVHWPGHLGAAVAFPEEVEGDYFIVDGRRFTVCDPTYIGAKIGMTMPDFKDVNAKIIKL